MTNNKFHELQFFNALRDIFVGAEIEGDSGFINLMQIKSRYYQNGVFPRLKKDIDRALEGFPGFREELFDKLYTFFQRYFSESGSIYFRYTPLHQNIYEKVYTDDRDVVLFWKTHMLYYVKTDRIFKSLKVTVDDVDFYFDASNIEHKRANEKRDIVFNFREVAPDGTLVFDTAYSVRGRITKIEQILRDLRKVDVEVADETLEKAFRVFEKQTEVDYFINKNARAFLEEQFDLWMYQYLFAEKNVWSAERIAQLQALKEIAYKVIGFISQFEDELVKIWNKPKFVRNSHYILTLDHLVKRDREDLLESLFEHQGMSAQMQEWVELGMLEPGLEPKELLRQITLIDLTGEHRHPEWLTLPLDTKHFTDFEIQLLSIFDDLDDALDGWLIHSENYQALNSLEGKFNSQIQSIYIDPPYNTDASEIDYVNNYKYSSWITLMANRLSVAKRYLKSKGVLCVTIDHFELANLKQLLDKENFTDILGLVTIKNNPSGRSTVKGFSIANEFALFYGKSGESEIGTIPRTEDQLNQYGEDDEISKFQWRNFLRSGGKNDFREARPRLHYPLIISEDNVRIPEMKWDKSTNKWNLLEHPEPDEVVIYPITGKGIECTWRLGIETLEKRLNDIRVSENHRGRTILQLKFRLKDEGVLPKTFWDDPLFNATAYGTSLLRDIFGVSQLFSFPKSVYAVEESLRVCNTQSDDLVLDYFAGSGTTAHAVMNLNREDGGIRKYILVEVGDHFHNVVIPRIKKIAFYSNWKNGKSAFENGKSGISQFVKYYSLEQYEETLQKVHYEDADLFNDPNQDPYHAYVFLRDLKLLESIEIDTEADRVRFHPERLYPDIDLAETLSHLRGKWIKRITEAFVEFQDGEKMSLTDPDWGTLKPMVWWG